MAEISDNTHIHDSRHEIFLDDDEEFGNKPKIVIPLMLKKQNSIEKYIKGYKSNKKTNQSINLDSSEVSARKSKVRSGLSSNASHFLFGKLTPDPNIDEEKDCYVKYVPVT